MEVHALRMNLRKRSSADSVDSMRSVPKSPTTQVLGQTKLDLPDTRGQCFFYLATHWTGQGCLRHYLSGLQTLDSRYKEMEVLTVGGIRVKGWSHSDLSCFLQGHLAHVTSATQFKMSLRAVDHSGRRHTIEIQFDVLFEDGNRTPGEKARAVFDVIIRVADTIITRPDVTGVTYEQCCYVRIRHGAQVGQFLRVADDTSLCMDVPGCPDAYVFRCYFFFGHNQTRCPQGRGRRTRHHQGGRGGSDGGGVGGGGGCGCCGSWPKMCVLQEPRTSRYVVASAFSGRLKADNDGQLHTDMQTIQKPDPRFFLLHPSGQGHSQQYCLRPLLLCNYYLRFDAVEGLKLKRCEEPPYKDRNQVRHFAFDFVPAESQA